DIEINIIVAKSVLEKLGYQVDIAMNGKEAIHKIENNQYDLVFLDIHLPDMTGFEIADYLHQQYEDEKFDYLPPLVALTANVVSNKQDYLKHGMDDVLQKPLSLDALNKCLLQLFNLQPENSSDKEKQINLHEVEITPSAQDKQWPQLDLSILDELYEILGKQAIQNNLKLFVATMPEYLQQLMQE